MEQARANLDRNPPATQSNSCPARASAGQLKYVSFRGRLEIAATNAKTTREESRSPLILPKVPSDVDGLRTFGAADGLCGLLTLLINKRSRRRATLQFVDAVLTAGT